VKAFTLGGFFELAHLPANGLRRSSSKPTRDGVKIQGRLNKLNSEDEWQEWNEPDAGGVALPQADR
jgi:hypothetical protein